MIANFASAMRALGGNATVLRIANAVRPAADRILNVILPERNRAGYTAKTGNITVRPTMAGIVGLDSPLPPVGLIDATTFLEETAKIGNKAVLTEKLKREIQEVLRTLALANQPQGDFIRNEFLNFLNKLVLQPNLDRFEWLRGQALGLGEIDWSFNQKNLTVDYGIPAANLLTTRTGLNAYSGSTSKFWEDVRSQARILGSVRARIVHPTLWEDIVANEANNIEILAQGDDGRVRVRRWIGSGTNFRASSDARDTVDLIVYGSEGEVFDPANPGQTLKVPFWPTTSFTAIGNRRTDAYRVGQGATETAPAVELGYTHIGPTVEGDGALGRWARVDVPDERPWQTRGECVANGLPVIEEPDRIVIASSDLSA